MNRGNASAVAAHAIISAWGLAEGKTFGDMLQAMARIAPSQPNEAMVRMAPRRNRTISLEPSSWVRITEKGSLDVDSKLFSKV